MKDINGFLESIDNRVLMTIFPHPDDETMASGGLLMTAKKKGWKTIVVSLTAGEAGQIYLKRENRSGGEIRKEELIRAAKVLGADEVVIGGFEDGKLRNDQRWGKWINGVIEKHKPGLVVTYDHSGFSGHPDHIAVSVFSETLNLPVLWTVPGGFSLKMVNREVRKYSSPPVYQLKLGRLWYRKWQAARCHKSQKLGKSLPIPLGLAFAMNPYEYYYPADKGKKYPYKYVKFEI